MNKQNIRYLNPRTGKCWSVDKAIWRAPDDGGYVNLSLGKGISRIEINPNEPGLWRYKTAIRLPNEGIRTLGEGWTPLVNSNWEDASILMKCEHLMPSGSFKDRGTAVLFNYLKQVGISEILEDSSGNAGSSFATYGAALGMNCCIMIPTMAPKVKKLQIAAMGADVKVINGTRGDVATAALAAAENTFYASHNWQPFFIEGTKTLAFELWEQMDFKVPDNIVVPLGYGSNTIGLYLGFNELKVAGEITRLPRIFGAQAANCAVFHAAWEAGGEEQEIICKATIADGIACQKPVRVTDVMSAIGDTGGMIVAVQESEILTAFRDLTRTGFFVEPTCAAAAAVLSNLLRDGVVSKDEKTVLVLTGSGLKATDQLGLLASTPY